MAAAPATGRRSGHSSRASRSVASSVAREKAGVTSRASGSLMPKTDHSR
jgi:hypothetical protein